MRRLIAKMIREERGVHSHHFVLLDDFQGQFLFGDEDLQKRLHVDGIDRDPCFSSTGIPLVRLEASSPRVIFPCRQ